MDNNIKKSKKLASNVKTSEMKNELEESLEGLRNKEGAINSKEVISKNKVKEMKGKVVKELFKILQGFGVDPSDLESINKFLRELEQVSPDLLKLFELTFNDLLKEPGETSDETVGAPTPPPAPAATPVSTPIPTSMPPSTAASKAPTAAPKSKMSGGLMDKYKNLGPGVLRR